MLLFLLIFVNGASDAPNSVSTAISSYSLSFKCAVRLAALADLLGVIIFSCVCPSVAYTVEGIATFRSSEVYVTCAAMLATVVWALLACRMGIPTSESYAMVSAISGAAVFSGGSASTDSWIKVVIGFILFSLLPLVLSPLIYKATLRLIHRTDRADAVVMLSRLQICFCFLCAFMHGAQDGQKFIGMMMLFSGNRAPTSVQSLTCAAVICIGTLCCSERIIKTTAFETVRLDRTEGCAADVSAFVSMLLASLTGIPVSTSNVKCCAMLGARISSQKKKPDQRNVVRLFSVWALTFPVCFLLGGIFYYAFIFILRR